ncbi:MAG: hypothetical protein R3280_16270, partial [Marinobacter sp.]|uniref:hypothetical protein n=1 Tax=Marinobacter sp. TaxID=50741 RepID=UPI00299DA33C
MATAKPLCWQRGALIAITPLVITAIVLMSVLALDGARLFTVQAQMQSQVNAAAAAAADTSQACGGQGISHDAMAQRALLAAQLQGYGGTAEALSISAGMLAESPGNAGELAFHHTSDLARTNAALVSYSRNEPISRLLPETMLGSLTLEARAAARKEVIATVSAAGSTTVIGGGLVGEILAELTNQPGYSLDPTDLESLENTLFQIGELMDTLAVDSVEQLLAVNGDQLAQALVTVGGALSPVGRLAGDLAGAAGIDDVVVGDLIAAAEGTSIPRGTRVRAYDLVMGLMLHTARQQQLLNGSPLVIGDLTGLGLPLGSDLDPTSLRLELFVNRAPTKAIGPARKDASGHWLTRFYAPDISLIITARARLQPAIDVLGLAEFSIAELSIPLAMDLGGGQGALVSARCARGSGNDAEFGIQVERQAVAVSTGSVDPATGDLVPADLEADIGRLRLLAGLITIDPALALDATIEGSIGALSESAIMEPSYPLFCDPVTGCARIVHNDTEAGAEDMALNVFVNDLQALSGSIDPDIV